ncbi:hypothetical protein SAMN05444164_8089 [Bradyrhizobium erythrophlei]|uniref:Uncharacterized protein n=1 Tax=Bradyrhizobium erythrophlei TaxID=1437360 RepID=A0A1H5ITR5_9BRAD|nr:hypothetical protein SAMN05444164_8089 [Bradyrhizobium erythrophlei]
MDCFAEPVIRRRFAPTGWLAMTVVRAAPVNSVSSLASYLRVGGAFWIVGAAAANSAARSPSRGG